MKVTILGSGTCVPTTDRGPPGVLVRAGGHVILVDLGPGILRRLPAAGVDLGDVDRVLFTHFHTDHTADLAPMLFALKNYAYRAREPLRIVGPKGLKTLYAALEQAWGAWIRPTAFAWTLEEVDAGATVDLGDGVTGRTVAVEHTPESMAWRIEDADGATVAISGDTSVCEGAVEAGREADLYVLECAVPDEKANPWHLSPSSAGAIASEAKPARLCLTHFYPECEGVDIAAQCRATWDGPLSLARDGLTFDVTSGAASEVAEP